MINRGIFTLVRQDLILTWRNGLVLVTVITLAVIAALYWTLPFIVREEQPLSQSQIFLDESENKVVESFFSDSGMTGLQTADTREELEAAVSEKTGAVGVVVTGTADQLEYELVFKNRPTDETINILKAVFVLVTAKIRGVSLGADTEIRLLRDKAEPITSSESLIPVMLAFEVLILGFLFTAVVVFGEKKEGSIKAYRVSPSGLANYLVSKTLVFTLMSLLYGLVMAAVTVGFGFSYLSLALLLSVSCALMTLLGLGVAAFFENLSQWFVPGVLLLSINMLAIIPFQIPSYSMTALTYLPGYNVVFGAAEILFPTGKTGFLGPVMMKLGAGAVIAGAFAAWAVRRKMFREG